MSGCCKMQPSFQSQSRRFTADIIQIPPQRRQAMMRRRQASAVLLVSLLWPALASAQQASGIAGAVTDASGAVLPGGTVEASSPALIEKVRTVVTDGEGRYNVVDLRPGTYTVTFTLPGFTTVRREGIAP